MSDLEANPEAGAIQPMTVVDAAGAFKGMFGSETANPEPENKAEPEPAPEAIQEGAEVENQEETQADSDEQPEVEAEEKTGRYTVKVDGQELKVTIEELKKGYQLEADYRKKTAEVAELRRAAEAERAAYKAQLEQFIPALQSQLQGKWAGVNWVELAKSDPAQYVALQAEYAQDQSKFAQARADAATLRAKAEEDAKRQYAEYLKEQQSLLAQKIPAFKDAEKGKQAAKEMADYLRNQGYTAEEVNGLADSRAALIAWKAMQYDRAQSARAEAAKKVAPAKPVQKPGVSQRSNTSAEKADAALNRLKQSGRTEDAAAAFRAMKIFG